MNSGTNEPDEYGTDDTESETEDDPEAEPDAAADATTADDDEGEIGERNIGGPY